MSQYLLVYLGGNKPATPEEGEKHFARYMEWLNSLGKSAISPANPLKETKTVNPDSSISDGGTTQMSGFTIIEAESMDAAIAVAQSCPFLEVNGSMEVSEILKMPSQK